MMVPIPATSGASTWAITSYSPVMASECWMPVTPYKDLATSIAFPADALISTYARTLTSSLFPVTGPPARSFQHTASPFIGKGELAGSLRKIGTCPR